MWQFGIADRCTYCSLECGSLLYLTAVRPASYSLTLWYSAPQCVLHPAVWQFVIADRCTYCILQCGSLL
jgi:hypothetical protein